MEHDNKTNQNQHKMTRSEFLKSLAALGVSTSFLSLLSSCGKEEFYPEFEVNFSGKVLVIGAGSAGLFAGYVLSKYNVDFEIIEASSVYGGRVKGSNNFTDFPIDLGAEWLHTDPSVFAKLINDNTVAGNLEMVRYRPETVKIWNGNRLVNTNLVSNFYSEYKFKDSSVQFLYGVYCAKHYG